MNNETMKEVMFWAAIVIGIGLVVAGMIWLVSLQKNAPAELPGSLTIDNVIAPDDWVKGNRAAKATLIEYADFQCPGCGGYSPVVNQLSADFGDKLAVVYRHFPLPQHANALPMIYAAEAAGLQDRFWEMHDLIFENQAAWSNQVDVKKIVVGYAAKIGLNVDKFTKDFESAEIKAKVAEILKKNDAIEITYTPTFFLNGKRLANPKNYENFKAAIDEALK